MKFTQLLLVLSICAVGCLKISSATESAYKKADIFQAHERLVRSKLIDQS